MWRSLRRGILLILLFFQVPIPIYAQNKQVIKGTVFDKSTSQPLPGVSVILKGTNNGTITNANGQFSIVAGKGNELVFSFIGYLSQEITVDGETNLTINMNVSVNQLGGLVVVGYGTLKRENLVSSVSEVAGSKILNSGIPNVSQALQGELPGLVATTRSGQPGADDASLVIRGVSTFNGSNAPLVLIDGIEQPSGFSQMDPGDIASISVLKDASATAIYGARGANGVILITTRRGKLGAPKITVSVDGTAKKVIGFPKELGALDAINLAQVAFKNGGDFSNLVPQRTVNMYKDPAHNPYLYPDVNWYKALIKPVGYGADARINVSGGTQVVKYYASLSYAHQGDIMNITNVHGFYDPRFKYDKYNFRSNLDFNLTKETRLRVDISGRTEITNQPNDVLGQQDYYNIFKDISYSSPVTFPLFYPVEFIKQHPDPYAPGDTLTPRLPDGTVMIPPQRNPYWQMNYRGFVRGHRDAINMLMDLHQGLRFITPGLSINGQFSYNTNSGYSKLYRNTVNTYYYNVVLGTWERTDRTNYNTTAPGFHPSAGESMNVIARNIYYQIKADYARSFGAHNVGFTGVFSRQERKTNIGDFPNFHEDWVGRATYNFKEKYILEIDAGYNGSERFARGKRFGFFPAVAIGWNIANERFVKENIPWVSKFKIRYSIGKSGSENGPRFLYEGGWGYFSSQTSVVGFGVPWDAVNAMIGEQKIPNANATWETSHKQDLGFDMQFFNNALSVTWDFYKERRDGIFVTLPLPSMYHPSVGIPGGHAYGEVGPPPVNAGKSKNKGMELVADYEHALTKKFRFNIGANLNYADNRIIYAADPLFRPDYQKQAGKPIGWHTAYVTNGYLDDFEQAVNAPKVTGGNMPGFYRWSDFNGNGQIDADDRAPMHGTSQPYFTYGFNVGFTYSGFSLRALFFGKGYTLYPATSLYWYPNITEGKIEGKDFQQDTWTPENHETKFPAFSSNESALYNNANDQNMVDAAYFRLQSLSLSYLLKSPWLENVLRIKTINTYLNASNIFTLSKVPFGDPEGGNSFSQGLGNYPLVKRITLGMRIGF